MSEGELRGALPPERSLSSVRDGDKQMGAGAPVFRLIEWRAERVAESGDQGFGMEPEECAAFGFFREATESVGGLLADVRVR